MTVFCVSPCKKDTSTLLLHFWKVWGKMHPPSGVPAYHYQQSLSRCFTCQVICVQQSHATKGLLS